MNRRGQWNGSLTVRAEGGSPERFFNLCGFHGISLTRIERDGNGYRFCIAAGDFYEARKLSRKAQVKLLIKEKRGLPFFLRRSRKRLAFYVGILVCTGLLYASSLFIWDIRMEGNTKYTDITLLHFLESKGYVHGMKKAGIVCEDIEKDIRNHYNDITWVSAEISGNRLIIRIKENQVLEAAADTGQEEEKEEAESLTGQEVPDTSALGRDVTASRGGIILSMITRTGTPAVHVGDTVEPGQILISGIVEIKDEGGNLLKTGGVKADGDVIASTTYLYKDSFSLTYPKQYYTGQKKVRRYLWLFGSRHYVPGGKNTYEKSDEVDTYSQVHLWGNFYLPVGWGTVTAREYRDAEGVYSETAAKEQAEKRFRAYCENLEAADVKVEEASYQVSVGTDTCDVTGTIHATEAIALTEE
ncbi:sporulation protein YqfD [Qiania dongpingensis]|uniref:Sporulation protein YqfD n=1 Tax=Qiania dongpingensis TaxID=2763669 RepID=A0A7G9G4W3_9FIRM|nr:sporulation protein YqfD [Qiania dongpingensis]QNM05845.1 sporulation protein YqfD [Qiania dongpingensis]